MPKFRFQSKRVDQGAMPVSELRAVTTEAQVNQAIAGQDIIVDVADVTEAQLRGIHQYIRACALGTNTSTVETAISAII